MTARIKTIHGANGTTHVGKDSGEYDLWSSVAINSSARPYVGYRLSLNPAESPITVTWQVYVDGKWLPYPTTPLMRAEEIQTSTSPALELHACRKCGTCHPLLYKEGERGLRAYAKAGESGLCAVCYDKFVSWKSQQHGLEPPASPHKPRGEQKWLGTGDLKLV